ncbi:MAG: lytic transglycosylase domain-containing protein [Bacteroidales bacterium]|jgi:hypothetical protein|nr:lytic transglycosylase domain-containing protein [Bacteroidales bacterium]
MNGKTIAITGGICIGVGLLIGLFHKQITSMIADVYKIYIKSNVAEFLQKTEEIAQKLSIHPNWLLAVMTIESGINHQVVNPNGGATGLIQFMPDTAVGMGTSTAALKNMTNVQQLDYVYKYLLPFKGKMTRFVDVYFAVFFPLAIGKPDTWVFETQKLSRAKIAAANPLFDTNKDGMLTVYEVREAMTSIARKKGLVI